MDNLRGQFPEHDGQDSEELDDDETGHEPPPAVIGQDERRMQVRAYTFWASLLEDRTFPPIEGLNPEELPDFGPYSVLLDFTDGIENPAIAFLGDELADECGTDGTLSHLSDVPSRSLLSRITEHYMQILANQAPIGFEAEFVNQRGATILYRGILLPFSSDDDTIDFIYGVINWKELADQQTTDELLLQIDQALEAAPKRERGEAPLTEWADGPVDLSAQYDAGSAGMDDTFADDLPAPGFGLETRDVPGETAAPDSEQQLPAPSIAGTGLADWLASARDLAEAAKDAEERSHRALYAAIGRAYDFAMAAAESPEEFEELLADAGLAVQQRAPMTPIVKLVFGADHDKTRLAEYAAVLCHAQRSGLGYGELAAHLESAPGGLKAIVAEERRVRRQEDGSAAAPQRNAPRESIARKLRQLEARPLHAVSGEGAEFALLVTRRLADGRVVVLGEVAGDVPLLERAARRLLGS
jgi:hypothetical protein